MRDTPRTDAITPLGLAKDGSIPHYVIELAGLCRNLERENADLLAALKELVRLKDIKEKIEAGSAFWGEEEDYKEHKEPAWQAARAAIVRYE